MELGVDGVIGDGRQLLWSVLDGRVFVGVSVGTGRCRHENGEMEKQRRKWTGKLTTRSC